MEVTCLILSVLAVLGAVGSAFFSRSSKPSSRFLSQFSDDTERLKEDWKAFRRQMLAEWEEAHHKLRSIAGRIDRQKRTDKAEAAGEAPPDGVMEDPVAAINRAFLRQRGINL